MKRLFLDEGDWVYIIYVPMTTNFCNRSFDKLTILSAIFMEKMFYGIENKRINNYLYIEMVRYKQYFYDIYVKNFVYFVNIIFK